MADRIVSAEFLNEIIMVMEEAIHQRPHREITGLIRAIHKLPVVTQPEVKTDDPGAVPPVQ